MSEIKMKRMTRSQMLDELKEYRAIDIRRVIRITDADQVGEEFVLGLAPIGPGSDKPFACYLSRDRLLELAQEIQRTIAPTPEDRILDALGRIEGKLNNAGNS